MRMCCMCTCGYARMCVCPYLCSVCVRVLMCMYVCACICVYDCMCAYRCMCVCVGVYVCMIVTTGAGMALPTWSGSRWDVSLRKHFSSMHTSFSHSHSLAWRNGAHRGDSGGAPQMGAPPSHRGGCHGLNWF